MSTEASASKYEASADQERDGGSTGQQEKKSPAGLPSLPSLAGLPGLPSLTGNNKKKKKYKPPKSWANLTQSQVSSTPGTSSGNNSARRAWKSRSPAGSPLSSPRSRPLPPPRSRRGSRAESDNNVNLAIPGATYSTQVHVQIDQENELIRPNEDSHASHTTEQNDDDNGSYSNVSNNSNDIQASSNKKAASSNKKSSRINRVETLELPKKVLERTSSIRTTSRSKKRAAGNNDGDDDDDDDDDDSDDDGPVYHYMYDGENHKFTEQHLKLLMLISMYSAYPRQREDKGKWLRALPLYVLVYEAIIEGGLDWDYAPCCKLIPQKATHSKRVWMNVSQEAVSGLDDLRECGLIGGLKLSTKDFQPVTAYQITPEGDAFLHDTIPQNYVDELNKVFYKPDGCAIQEENQLQVEWRQPPVLDEDESDQLVDVDDDPEEGYFTLTTPNGHYQESDITDIEDVSYVSSPYIPSCYLNDEKLQMTSNAHRIHEVLEANVTIRDELDEIIMLKEPRCLVSEWMPFGANQIVALNERLGALDRCQGGMFTAMVDLSPTDTQFQIPSNLTNVKIVDFDFLNFINFEAQVSYPEASGIIQVETFGMHLDVDGTVCYGIKMDAIVDRCKDDFSMDLLARVLVDVHEDSSKMMRDLLSAYQRDQLAMVFKGDELRRAKLNFVLAEGTANHVPAAQYMDKGDFENELKQVIGDILKAYDLDDEHVLILGQLGVFFSGPRVMEFETSIACYMSLVSREMFIRNFFIRLFMLDDSLKTLRRTIKHYREDPNHIQSIRRSLNDVSRDIILGQEILKALDNSLESMVIPTCPIENKDRARQRLFDTLDLPKLKLNLETRTADLKSLLQSSANQLKNLEQMQEVINTGQLESVLMGVEANTRYLVQASAANERSSSSLELMQVILAGSFAFDILDRVCGGTLNMDPPDFVEELADYLIHPPGVWFILNMVWLVGCLRVLIKLMRYMAEDAKGVLTLQVKPNLKIYPDALEKWIEGLTVEMEDCASDPNSTKVRKVSWVEIDPVKWKGPPPKIELVWDSIYGYLLTVFFSIHKKKSNCTEQDLMDILWVDLEKAGVVDPVVAQAVWKPKDEDDEDDEDGKGGEDGDVDDEKGPDTDRSTNPLADQSRGSKRISAEIEKQRPREKSFNGLSRACSFKK